jgi:hypothetical protein
VTDPPQDDPRNTPFTSILRYVLGFMGAMALLAFFSVWMLRHC